MVVFSAFDGMSCGQFALEKGGFYVKKYFASELKKTAIKCTQDNFPNTIQLGDIRNIKASDLPKIDLFIGGSPCQDFSVANKERKGLKGEKSKLFYEYVRLLKETKPRFFLLENVFMENEGYSIISDILGIEPVRINGSKVSAALRDRYYWTNIGPKSHDLFGNPKCAIPQPIDKKIYLNDILDYGYADKRKHTSLDTKCGAYRSQPSMIHRYKTTGMTTIIFKDEKMRYSDGVRYCNQSELERLHNLPEGCTRMLTQSQAGNLIGDGWTVDVVKHIFSFLPKEYLKQNQ